MFLVNHFICFFSYFSQFFFTSHGIVCSDLYCNISLPCSCTGSHRGRKPASGFPRYSQWGSNENNTPVTQSNDHLQTLPSLNQSWQYHSEDSTYNALIQGLHQALEIQRTQGAGSSCRCDFKTFKYSNKTKNFISNHSWQKS